MNRVDRTIIFFENDSSLSVELRGRLFELKQDERALVTGLMDLISQFKEAKSRKQKEKTP